MQGGTQTGAAYDQRPAALLRREEAQVLAVVIGTAEARG
jgi:hypothetical protein